MFTYTEHLLTGKWIYDEKENGRNADYVLTHLYYMLMPRRVYAMLLKAVQAYI